MTKARPILFSTEMVKAILEDRKKQTRRTKNLDKFNVNPDLYKYLGLNINKNVHIFGFKTERGALEKESLKCPYGKPGDILWVRETFTKEATIFNDTPADYIYKADELLCENEIKWKPSIFMPKEACRLFLKIKDIRVERLIEISEEDAMAEGIDFQFSELFQENRFMDYLDINSDYRTAYCSFQSLWEKINGLDSWKANPWVWVIEFEKIEKPEGWA